MCGKLLPVPESSVQVTPPCASPVCNRPAVVCAGSVVTFILTHGVNEPWGRSEGLQVLSTVLGDGKESTGGLSSSTLESPCLGSPRQRSVN